MEGFLPHLLLFFLDFKAKDGSAHPFSLESSWWPVSLQNLVVTSSPLGRPVYLPCTVLWLQSSWLPLWMRRWRTSPELAYLTNSALQLCPFCCQHQGFILLYNWHILESADIHSLSSSICPLMDTWAIPHQDWRQHGPAGISLCVDLISIGYKPRSRIAGSWSRSIFNSVGSLCWSP